MPGHQLCGGGAEFTIRTHGWPDRQLHAPLPHRHAGDVGSAIFREHAHLRLRAQRARRARDRRQPADRRDAGGALRAGGRSARQRRCSRSSRCSSAARSSSTTASCCTARSATGSRRCRWRRHRAHDVEGHARGGRPRRRAARAARVARATPAGRRASSRRKSRERAGSPSRRDTDLIFDMPPEARYPRRCAARHRFLAPFRGGGARVTATGTVLAFDFGSAASAWRSATALVRVAHPLTTIELAERTARFAAIDALVARMAARGARRRPARARRWHSARGHRASRQVRALARRPLRLARAARR